MKHYTALLIVLCLSNTLLAQGYKVNSAHLTNHRNMVRGLLKKQAIVEANLKNEFNTRVLTERVIGQRTIDNMFSTYADSVNVNYIFNGTSMYDYNMMLYPYNYCYSTSPMFNFQGVFTSPQVQYITYNHFTVNPNTLVYGFYQSNFDTYDANKNLTNDTTLFADSSSYNNMIYENKFNAMNTVDTSYSYNWIGGTASPAFKQFFSYNVSNLVSKDSIYIYHLGSWYLVSKTYYLYNVANNLVKIDQYANTTDTTYTMPLIQQFQYLNTYDASNRLTAVVTSFYDGAALNQYVKDTFNYTGTSTFHTDWKEYQWDPINVYWAPIIYMDKHLNALGYPDTIFTNVFDSLANMWVTYYRDDITYNTMGNPQTINNFIFNFVSFPATPDFSTTYYYETFTNTTEAQDLVATHENFNLFPNPNNGNMELKYVLNVDALMYIYDYTGKKINSYKLLAGKNSLAINENELVSGVYFYKVVTGKDILVWDKFVVVR